MSLESQLISIKYVPHFQIFASATSCQCESRRSHFKMADRSVCNCVPLMQLVVAALKDSPSNYKMNRVIAPLFQRPQIPKLILTSFLSIWVNGHTQLGRSHSSLNLFSVNLLKPASCQLGTLGLCPWICGTLQCVPLWLLGSLAMCNWLCAAIP